MKTYSPILKSEEFKNSFFVKVPVAKEGQAIVLTVRSAAGKAVVVTSQEGPAAKEIRNGKFDWQTHIDTSLHTVEVDMKANSVDYIHYFQIRMSFQAKVLDPVQVYRSNIRDVAAYIKSSIDSRIQEEAAKYKMEQVREFRKYLNDEFQKVFQLREEGMQIKLVGVYVDMDASAKEHLKRLNSLKEKEIYMKQKAAAAASMGESLEPDTGVLMSILDGTRSPEELEGYRQRQRTDSLESNLERIRMASDFVEEQMKKGVYSEKEAREMRKQIIGNSEMKKLCDPVQNTERIEENQENEYASFDD